MGILSNIGESFDYWGTKLKLPEFGVSEAFAQGPTANTASQVLGVASPPPQSSGGANESGMYPVVNQPTNNNNYKAPATQNPASTQTLSSSGFNQDLFNQYYPGWDYGPAEADWKATGGSKANQSTGENTSQEDLLKKQAALDLQDALAAYDKNVEEYELQKTEAGQEKESLLGTYKEQGAKAETQAGKSIAEAEEQTTSAQRKALSTSQDVIRKNRNILRSLGILSSSAAGEMLSRPSEEYASVAADLNLALNKRKGQVDEWLRERQSDVGKAVEEVNQTYTNLINRINSDIRYTGAQRANAVQSAQVALQQKTAELKQQAQAYQQSANQYTANMLGQIAQIQLYQNPQADVSGILSQAINAASGGGYSGGQAAIFQGQQKKDQFGNLLSD